VLKVINYLSAPRFDLASARDDFFTSSEFGIEARIEGSPMAM
jgi:hypothetical protein